MENLPNQNAEQIGNSNSTPPKQTGKVPSWIGFVIIIAFAVMVFGGVFAYQYFFVKPQPIVQTPQTQANQTAGWKTYTNSEYGFSFQYPKKYSVRMAEPSTTLFFIEENQKNVFEISIVDLSKYPSLSSYIRGLCDADGPTASITCDKIVTQETAENAEKFYLNNIITSLPSGQKTQKTVGPLYEIKIPNSTRAIFVSEAGILFSAPNSERENELDQILSTFKFTN